MDPGCLFFPTWLAGWLEHTHAPSPGGWGGALGKRLKGFGLREMGLTSLQRLLGAVLWASCLRRGHFLFPGSAM